MVVMTPSRTETNGDDGYMLVGCIVLIFVVMLTLSVAAPTIAKQLRREREVESQQRAQQYVRAIRVFYRKNGNHYPTSIDQLKNTNNQKFLRQEYIDPLTGKADWRLIHVGENQTTVKGFFGTDLPGIAGASGLPGIGGSGAGGTGSTGTGSGSAGTGSGSGVTGSTFGSSGSGSGSSGATGSTFGSSGSGTGGAGSTTGSGSSSNPLSGGGGLIMGVGSNKSGEAMLVVNGKDRYEEWEFLYDPRIEQLYAKGALNAGAPSSSGTSGSGFGSSGSSSGSGATGSSPFGSSGSGAGSGTTTPH